MTTIIRVEKKEQYSIIPNGVINDKRLSWEARGMLIYLLSKPNDWVVRLKDLINQSPCGRDKTKRILKELEQFGYLERKLSRQSDGKFYWESIVREEPQPKTETNTEEDGGGEPRDFTANEEPVDGKPVDGFSVDGNPVDILNTDPPITDQEKSREFAYANSRGEHPAGAPQPDADNGHFPLLNDIPQTPSPNPPTNTSKKKRAKQTKRQNDPRLKHPAIQAWSRASGIKPWRLNNVQRGMIVERVRDAPEALKLWEESVRHWFEHGWNPVNLRGQLEFYENGGPETCKVCSKAHNHRGGNGHAAHRGYDRFNPPEARRSMDWKPQTKQDIEWLQSLGHDITELRDMYGQEVVDRILNG